MEILKKYLTFIDSIFLDQGYFIPDFILLPFVGIFHILIILFLYFIYKKSRKKWRVRASYRYLKKIRSISGDNKFARTISYLRKIDPFIFEEMILSVIQEQKFKIYRNKKYTGDGGIDGRFKVGRKIYYIQAKRYQSHIAKKHVEEFNYIVARDKVKGVFIHTGKTGKGSKNIASKNVSFISGEKLVNFLNNNISIDSLLK